MSNSEKPQKSITLIDATSDSLTVSWPEIPTKSSTSTAATTRYVLQYKKATADDSTFETLSDKLSSTQARKKI